MEQHDLQVSFNPPLFLQRQAWILDMLRHENIQSVLDIGCGEGALLECLSQPAWSLPPPFHACLSPHERDLYIHTLHGLDPSPINMGYVNDVVTPEEIRERQGKDEFQKWWKRQPRWLDTQVSLWEGGFELLNEEVFGHDHVEAFVAAEVIEHLSPNLLPLFAPVLLGRYRPRLVLLTTPNYTYNQRFTPPGKVSSRGFLDPTNRTNRIFRHNDHKFEWTSEEWIAYCTSAAQKFGYMVEIDGIGQAVEPDPWHREETLGFATQVAVFKRLDDAIPRNVVLNLPEPLRKPVLRAHYHHKKHPVSDTEHVNLEDVRAIVEEQMRANSAGTMTLSELWHEGQVGVSCKGDIGILLHALGHETAKESWVLGCVEDGWSMEVTWKAFVPGIPETEQVRVESPLISDDDYPADAWVMDESESPEDRADPWSSRTMESSWGPDTTCWGWRPPELSQPADAWE